MLGMLPLFYDTGTTILYSYCYYFIYSNLQTLPPTSYLVALRLLSRLVPPSLSKSPPALTTWQHRRPITSELS